MTFFKTLFDLDNGYINKDILTSNKNYLNYEFNEKFDYNKLNFIVDNLEKIKCDCRPYARDSVNLHKYIKESKLSNLNYGVKTSKYKQNYDGLYGRLYANLSAQGMLREVKATIFDDYYLDIDLINAHPVITSWICDNLNIECPKLKEYIANREDIIKELTDNNDCNREFVKKCFISILYGSKSIDGVYRIKDESDEEYFNRKILKNNTKFIEDFKIEIIKNYNAICSKLKKFCSISKNKKYNYIKDKYGLSVSKDLFNFEGTALSHINLFVENQLLLVILDYLYSKLNNVDFYSCVLCFDGLMILKDAFKQEFIVDINDKFNELGINIELKIKQMTPLDLGKYGFDANKKYSLYKSNMKPENIALNTVLDKNDNYYKEKNLLYHTGFYDVDIADYFIQSTEGNGNFLFFNDILYYYNGNYWKNDTSKDSSMIRNLLSNAIYNKFYNIIESLDIDNDFRKFLMSKISVLRKNSGLTGVVKCIYSKIIIYNDIFDANPYLICFTNGTYDLENNVFRQSDKYDYLTRNIGYDYEFIDDNDKRMLDLNAFLIKIMPDKDKLDLFLSVLSTTLQSITLEKFIILTGGGRNGKDTIMTYLMKYTLGELYYEGSVNAITNECNTDLNVAMANCHKKNCLVMNEPATKKKVICNQVKQLTGGSNVNCRGLYSSNCSTKLTSTLFMMANDLPLLDHPDDAIFMRLMIFKFDSTFLPKDKLDDMGIYKEGLHTNGKYYYYQDKYYKTENFINYSKLAMMNLLIKNFNIYKNNNYTFNESVASVKDEVKYYMIESCEFMGWFNSCYELSDDKNDYIQLKDIYNEYINSYLYDNLTKADKRKNNKTWLFNKIKNSIHLKKYFYEQKYFFKDKKNIKNILINYKVKIETDDDDYDDMTFY